MLKKKKKFNKEVADFFNIKKRMLINKQIDLFTQNIEKEIKSLDVGQNKTIDKEKEKLIKEFIQDQTELPFDENDPQWRKFVIRYFHVSNYIGKYNRSAFSAFGSFFLLYGIMVYIFSLFNLSNTPSILSNILSKNSFMTFVSYAMPYVFIYFVLVIYIVPYAVTYYSLRKEVNLTYILFKNIKLTKWKNIYVFVIFLIVCYSFLILYISH